MAPGTRSCGKAGNVQDQSSNLTEQIASQAAPQAPILLPNSLLAQGYLEVPMQPGPHLTQFEIAPYLGYTRKQLDVRFAME